MDNGFQYSPDAQSCAGCGVWQVLVIGSQNCPPVQSSGSAEPIPALKSDKAVTEVAARMAMVAGRQLGVDVILGLSGQALADTQRCPSRHSDRKAGQFGIAPRALACDVVSCHAIIIPDAAGPKSVGGAAARKCLRDFGCPQPHVGPGYAVLNAAGIFGGRTGGRWVAAQTRRSVQREPSPF